MLEEIFSLALKSLCLQERFDLVFDQQLLTELSVQIYFYTMSYSLANCMLEYLIRYDPGADAIYIRIKEDEVAESEEIGSGIIVDYNNKGEIVGIELLEFSKKKADLGELMVKGLPVLR
jgi:uncharacterized protein YuzE